MDGRLTKQTTTQQLENKMSTEQKGKMIGNIIESLRTAAKKENKSFDEGDTFFSLAFKSDKELQKIAALCGA